jgi:hypothetical protein
VSPRKKTIYFCVIAVGAAAFGVDRVFFQGGPLPVDAAVLISPSVRSTPPAVAAPLVQGASADSSALLLIPEIPFPSGLASWNPDNGLRDLFEPVYQTVEYRRPEVTHRGTKDRSAQAVFAERHVLQAVFVRDEFRVAVVDGVWLRPGDTFDGCTFREFQGESAVFACRDGDAVLSMVRDRSANRP